MAKIIKMIIEFLKALFSRKVETPSDNNGNNGGGDTKPVQDKPIDNAVPEEEVFAPDEESIVTDEKIIADEVAYEEEAEEFNGELICGGKASKIKILIDNGHGDNTPGKRSPFSMHKVEPSIDFYEYKWNREIAKPLVERLKSMGYDAELIVTEDTDISLGERVRRVNAYCDKLGADNVIFISVHANAAGDGKKWMTGRGWSAYTTKGKTKSDTLAEHLYAAADKNFPGMKIRRDMTDGDSDQEANFYVCLHTKCPSVLTENFFYDNIDDVKFILSDEGRELVIKTHIDGIISYLNTL